MVIKTKIMSLFKAGAFTVCPFIFIQPGMTETEEKNTLKHEWVHWFQQLLFGVIGAAIGALIWFFMSWPPQPATTLTMAVGIIEGWVGGQFLWRFLYLFCLPIKWNPFRRYWETEAYKANGYGDQRIQEILKGPPYYLS